jgi:hypothetical protein
MTTTVLVDTSVRSAANVLEWTTERKPVAWGRTRHSFDVAVMVRRNERDLDHEEQVRALPTITRLVREGHLTFATYTELDFEDMNGRRPSRTTVGDLFGTIDFRMIEPAIDRSFFGGIAFPEGAKSEALRTFCHALLTKDFCRDKISPHRLDQLPRLTVESLKAVSRFREICRNAQPNHYPDLFHLWTGEVNECPYFLTMEARLPNFCESHLGGRLRCTPVRPIQLLHIFGMLPVDPLPCEIGDVLSFVEATNFTHGASGR